MRRSILAVFIAALFVVTALPAAALLPTERVLALGGDQWRPSGNDSYLAYQSNSDAQPNRWNVFAFDRGSEETTKLNAAGTLGYAGNFAPGTNTLIYQQVDGSSSDIYTYDLDSDTRTGINDINTSRWEWSPRILTGYVLFIRNQRHRGHLKYFVYLRSRTSTYQLLLGRYRFDRVSISADSVGESFASWTVCQQTCTVYVFDIMSETATAVWSPNSRPQYGSALDEVAGSVYVIRSGFGCGLTVGIFEVALDNLTSLGTKIVALPEGVDADYLSVAPDPISLENDLLFSRFRCRANADADVWAVNGVS